MKYSFVLPYFHRPEQFKNTLDSYLEYVSKRDDYEILIMESERNYLNTEYHKVLVDLVEPYKKSLNIRIERVFGYTGVTPAVAYNYGVCMAQGTHILFTQPEIKFMNDVLKGLDKQFEETPNSFILVGTKWYKNETRIVWKNSADNPEGENYPFAIAMRKEIYKECGYDLIYAAGYRYEDTDWRDRLREYKEPLVITNLCVVAHQPHPKHYMHGTHWPIKKLVDWNLAIYRKYHPEIPEYKVPPICKDVVYEMHGVPDKYHRHTEFTNDVIRADFYEEIAKLKKVNKRKTIPKIWHVIWIGSEISPELQRLIDHGREILKGWEVRVWTELPDNLPQTLRYLIGRHTLMPCMVADIMRYWILFEHGGVYTDIDTVIMKDFKDILKQDSFVGFQPNKTRIANGVLGCVPRSEAMLHVINRCIDERSAKGVRRIKFGPHIFTKFKDELRQKGMTIYPAAYFHPVYHRDRNPPIRYWRGNEKERVAWMKDKAHLFTKDPGTPYTLTLWGSGQLT